jgi:hypothetical protein
MKHALADKVPIYIDNILNKSSIFFKDKYISLTFLIDDVSPETRRISEVIGGDLEHIHVVGAGMEVEEYLNDEQLEFCRSTSYPFVFDKESISHILNFSNVVISHGVSIDGLVSQYPDMEFIVIGDGVNSDYVQYVNLDKFIQKYKYIFDKIIKKRRFDNKPSKASRVFQFVQSMIKYAASGFENAELDVSAARIKICESCPEFVPYNRTCGICSCYMDLKTKIAASECPLKKWLSVQEMKNEPKGCGCGAK